MSEAQMEMFFQTKDTSSVVKTCTPDNPYDRNKEEFGVIWEHANAHEVGEQRDGWPGGDVVVMHCPNCGMRWKSELPQ